MTTATEYTMTATHDCGFTGTLAALALHSCTIQEFGGQCEDFPCCGHTDGGGCQTTPEMTSAYWTDGPGREHLMCDHEAGVCDAYDDEPDEWGEADPATCDHGDTSSRGWEIVCDRCGSDGFYIVKVDGFASPVDDWKFEKVVWNI